MREVTITGPFYRDNYGFTNVFVEDVLYTLTCDGNYGRRRVGGSFTQEMFDEMKSNCKSEGTFVLFVVNE